MLSHRLALDVVERKIGVVFPVEHRIDALSSLFPPPRGGGVGVVQVVYHTIVQAFYDHIDRARTLHYKSVKNDAVAMTARRCERGKLDEDGWH